MRRGFGSVWVVTGLVLLGATIAGGREARAALTGITITGGTKPGTGDPPYDYIFNVYLQPNFSIQPYASISVNPFAITYESFTIDGLVGVTEPPASGGLGGSTTTQPGKYGTSVFWVSSIDQTSFYSSSVPNSSDVSNVTWLFEGNQAFTYNPSTNGYVGSFEVVTTDSFNQPPISPTTPVTYGYTVSGTNVQGNPVTLTESGTVYLTNLAAPEPPSSTIVLLTGGTAAVCGLVVRARRRRLARTT